MDSGFKFNMKQSHTCQNVHARRTLHAGRTGRRAALWPICTLHGQSPERDIQTLTAGCTARGGASAVATTSPGPAIPRQRLQLQQAVPVAAHQPQQQLQDGCTQPPTLQHTQQQHHHHDGTYPTPQLQVQPWQQQQQQQAPANQPPDEHGASRSPAAPLPVSMYDSLEGCGSIEELLHVLQQRRQQHQQQRWQQTLRQACFCWSALRALQRLCQQHLQGASHQQQLQQQEQHQQQQQQQPQHQQAWCRAAVQVLQMLQPHWQQLRGAPLAKAAAQLVQLQRLLSSAESPALPAEQHSQQQQQGEPSTSVEQVLQALQELSSTPLPPQCITAAVTLSATPQQLQALLVLLEPQLNGVHVTATLVRLARLQQGGADGSSAAVQILPVPPSTQVLPLPEQPANQASSTAPGTAQAMAAAAAANAVVHQMLHLLVHGGLLQQLTAPQAAQVIWALGKLQLPAAEPLQGLQQQQHQQQQQEEEAELEHLQQQLLGICLEAVAQLGPQEMVMLLHGCVLSGWPLTAPQQQLLLGQLQQRLGACSGHELGVLAWCLYEWRLVPGAEWWQAWWQAVERLLLPTAAAAQDSTTAAAVPMAPVSAAAAPPPPPTTTTKAPLTVAAAAGVAAAGSNGTQHGSRVQYKAAGQPMATGRPAGDGVTAAHANGTSSTSRSSSRARRTWSSNNGSSSSSSSSSRDSLRPVEVCQVLRTAAALQQHPPASCWQRIQTHTLQQLREFSQQELAMLLWSWARLGKGASAAALEQLAAAAGQLHASFTPQSTALVLYAAARIQQQQQQQQQLGPAPPETAAAEAGLEAAQPALHSSSSSNSSSGSSSSWQALLPGPSQLASCNGHDLVMVAYAADQLGLRLPPGWMEQLLQQACATAGDITPQGLLALVTIVQKQQQQQQQQGPAAGHQVLVLLKQLLHTSRAAAVQQLPAFEPVALAQLTAALVQGAAWLHSQEQWALGLPPQQQLQQQAQWHSSSSSSSWALLLQRSARQQQPALRKLAQLAAKPAGFTHPPQVQVQLQQAVLPSELLLACCRLLTGQVRCWDGGQIAKLLWSLSRLSCTACDCVVPDALLAAVYKRLQQLQGVATGQQVATSLYALAKMGLRPPSSWVDQQLQQLSVSIGQLPSQNLAEVAAAVAAFDWVPPQPWLRSYMKALTTAAAGGMSPWQLRRARLGLAAVAPKAADRWEQLLQQRRQQEQQARQVRRLFGMQQPPPAPVAPQQQPATTSAAAAAAAAAVGTYTALGVEPWLQQAVATACDDLLMVPPAASGLLLSSCRAASSPAGRQLLHSVLLHGANSRAWVARVTPRSLEAIVLTAAAYGADAAAVQRLLDAAAPVVHQQVERCLVGGSPQQQAQQAVHVVGMLHAVARLQQRYLADYGVLCRLRRRGKMQSQLQL